MVKYTNVTLCEARIVYQIQDATAVFKLYRFVSYIYLIVQFLFLAWLARFLYQKVRKSDRNLSWFTKLMTLLLGFYLLVSIIH